MKKITLTALLLSFAVGIGFAHEQNDPLKKFKADTARIGAESRAVDAGLKDMEKQIQALKDKAAPLTDKKNQLAADLRESVIRMDLAALSDKDMNGKYCLTASALSILGEDYESNDAKYRYILRERKNIQDNRVVFSKIINEELRANGLTNKKSADIDAYKKVYEKYKGNKIMLSALFSSYLENTGVMKDFAYGDYFEVSAGFGNKIHFEIYEALYKIAPDEINYMTEFIHGQLNCYSAGEMLIYAGDPGDVSYFKEEALKQNISPALKKNIDTIFDNAFVRGVIRGLRTGSRFGTANIIDCTLYHVDQNIDFAKVRPELKDELGVAFFDLVEFTKTHNYYNENKEGLNQIEEMLIRKDILKAGKTKIKMFAQ
ncbi:hypothetical protein Dip518_001542 [Parelusimicrobium proximum]|uniref:hypothetical protein n=1 Tax=Parelusimicrobium proximum TaxID=3228953 RepID=UPI003D186EF5